MSATREFAKKYVEFDPKAAANCLEGCSLEDVLEFLGSLENHSLKSILPHLNIYIVGALIKALSPESAAEILTPMRESFVATVLRSQTSEVSTPILESLGGKIRERVERRMEFLPDTAGAFMDSSVLPFRADQTVKYCLDKISDGTRSHYYIYLVSPDDVLIGVTTMRRVFETRRLDLTLQEIMEENVNSLRVDDGAQEILKNAGWERFFMMPVTDYKGKYLGVLRYDAMKKIDKRDRQSDQNAERDFAGEALGDLYSIGISAFVEGASSIMYEKRSQS